MPLLPTDIEYWLSINNPENDTAQSGGAIQDDIHASGGIMALFTDIPVASSTIRVFSNGSDIRTVTVTGRLATGVLTSEALVLNGTNNVDGVTAFQRINKIVLNSLSALRTVTVRCITGGTDIVILTPNCIAARRLFYDSTSDPLTIKTRYELLYIKNKSATNALLSGTVNLSADPEAVMEMGISLAVNTNETAIANRLAVPAGIVFTDAGTQAIPNGGTLNIGQKCGIWLKQTLLAGLAAKDSTVSVRVAGSTS
jgi:hypothetical protein